MSVAYLSDRIQMRGIMCIILGLVSVAGYALLLSPSSAGAHYTGLVLSMWSYVACESDETHHYLAAFWSPWVCTLSSGCLLLG